MKIEINHVTRYSYLESVMDSVNELRLTPRTNYRQSCYHHEVSTEPSASLFTYEDYFGNRVHSFSINKPHKEMVIKTKAIVVTQDQSSIAKFGLPYKGQLELLQGDQLQNRYIEFLQPTSYTEINEDLLAYSAQYPVDEEGFYAWAMSLMSGINSDFIYDPDATNVNTQISDTLRLRRGVCQDYTHLMIAVCRSMGIPARYVSGYHFVGDLQGGSADFEQASHAWVEVHVPGTGWLGFDPTNNAEVDWRYVKLGHGRDYKDIVPVKGVYRGTAKQKLKVTVDVRLLEG
ncbi:transglutaminase family protein [Paenibacillus sp. WQ 127069]|uniref:Transglutaminase family protein n=1 Tax=Paenibacillus baimaensis TaxID=2982185 RepID=A0ABT2URJ9_9BACL|nr:transglutaminase family protein [Paenibacillus sp. WQ 127069]MCU6797167.1 transglutaminase family protein [Paenibacillus sp. WQ 127069]